MYGEHPDGGMTEIESRDVDFLEEDFPSIGEVKKDLKLYELEEPLGDLSPSHMQDEDMHPHPIVAGDSGRDPSPSRSVPLSGSVPLEDSQDPQIRRSQRRTVPRRRFEIEGESFMTVSVDVDEPASLEEAIKSPASDKWIVTM